MSLDEKIDTVKTITNIVRGVSDTVGWIGLYYIESIREEALHPTKGVAHFLRSGQADPTPWITHANTSPALYDILNHAGDWLEGFYLTGLTYWALSATKLSERAKFVTATAFSLGFISLYEMGITHNQEPDPKDIPIGLVGAGIYVGWNLLVKQWIDPPYVAKEIDDE
jgi:hypothetical protein